MTRPCFRDKGKSPDERNKLTIDAIGAEIFSINTFSREPVAQLVEHRAVTREVVSSTPAGPTLRVLK